MIIKLSHIFGSHVPSFSLTLPVPTAKKALLYDEADQVTLKYFAGPKFGYELLEHASLKNSAKHAVNLITEIPCLYIKVNNKHIASQYLKQLGFANDCLSGLYPIKIVLEEDPAVDPEPKIDTPGFSGLSFLVKDLDEVGKKFKLIAHQEFEHDGLKKRVAFYNKGGICTEFLEIRRGDALH